MIVKPVFIIGSPRNGTTLLFQLLSQSEHLWSLYDESTIWNQVAGPQTKAWKSMELTAADATFDVATKIRHQFLQKLQNKQSDLPPSQQPIRMVEKTPDNCFRIDFIRHIFPDAYFVYIQREGKNTISSMINAWRYYKKYSLPVPTHIDLQNGSFTDKWWGSLPPGWEKYIHRPVSEICLFQWREANLKAKESLSRIPKRHVVTVRFEDLMTHPKDIFTYLCKRIEIPFSEGIQKELKRIYPIDPNKWEKENKTIILRMEQEIEETMRNIGYKEG